MGSRVLYSCDWCGVDAPKPDEVPGEWSIESSGSAKVYLCGACCAARAAAVASARVARLMLRRSEP